MKPRRERSHSSRGSDVLTGRDRGLPHSDYRQRRFCSTSPILRVGRERHSGVGTRRLPGSRIATDEWGFTAGERWFDVRSPQLGKRRRGPGRTIADRQLRRPDRPDGDRSRRVTGRASPPGPPGIRGRRSRWSPDSDALLDAVSDWRGSARRKLRIFYMTVHYYVRGGYEEMWRLDPPLAPFPEEDRLAENFSIGPWASSSAAHHRRRPARGHAHLDGRPWLLKLNHRRRGVPRNGPLYRKLGTYAQRTSMSATTGRPATGLACGIRPISTTIGRLDLFIAKGNVDQDALQRSWKDPNNLLMPGRGRHLHGTIP